MNHKLIIIHDRIMIMNKKWNSDNVHQALSKVKIASPCKVPLSEMEDRGNCFHCKSCDLNVYQFSKLTNSEIADLMNDNNEKLCIGIFRREDGTIITKDCPLGLRDVGFIYRKSGLIKAIAFVLIILMGLAYIKPRTNASSNSQMFGKFDRSEFNIDDIN